MTDEIDKRVREWVELLQQADPKEYRWCYQHRCWESECPE